MPRLKVVDPKTAMGETKEIFETILRGKHLNIFKGMANSPTALNGYLALKGTLDTGTLSEIEREIIALVIAERNECDYCLAAHTAAGKRAGLSVDDTLSIRAGEHDDPKIQALIDFTEAIHAKKGFVSDGDVEDFLAAGYDEGHVVEVVANVALNFFTNYFNHINDTEVDLPAAPDFVGQR
ncbi:MAG: carboxymuconolactone decarboxylase family protein [Candidatus Omnitrophica bacterium]|nr:carboxymuconolactone decarboxylase family protein [Candidatus Omnitrophota bacterium]